MAKYFKTSQKLTLPKNLDVKMFAKWYTDFHFSNSNFQRLVSTLFLLVPFLLYQVLLDAFDSIRRFVLRRNNLDEAPASEECETEYASG